MSASRLTQDGTTPSGASETTPLVSFDSPAIAKAKVVQGPIFLENPDGTITEAIPSSLKDKHKISGLLRDNGRTRNGLSSDNDSDGSTGSMSEAAAVSMYEEVDFLYSRHERVLILLLLTQLALEILYDVVYVTRMKYSIMEFIGMYNMRINPKVAEAMFWTIFVLQALYSIVYYVIAVLALWTKRPKPYRMLANWSLVGIVALVLLAYVDKFNLLIFFLRLLAYIYARFLQGLTASLLLLPPATNAAPGAGLAAAVDSA